MSHSIIIHTENEEELSLLEDFAKKMGFNAQILSQDDKEDIGIAEAIKQNNPIESLQLNEAIEYYKKLSKSK
ncbi:MAG: hypothetical protein H7Y13_14840 [Sphingobacteriaceae bacterium]|nr:hypothetical protein [Sphingobacteriaceae bacterium]